MKLILDTDCLSIVQNESQPAFNRLQARLLEHPEAVVQTTVVSFQEQVQGWLAFLNRAKNPSQVLLGYRELWDVVRDYVDSIVLPFDEAAQSRFEELQELRLRVGTMDLRIASIALATSSTLLTRNLRDFRKVPDLVVEDWTQ